MERPHIGQGRAGSTKKRPDPINHPINKASNLSQKIPGRMEIETKKTNHVHFKDLTHSINNASGKMTNKNLLILDVPSIQVQFTRHYLNSSSKMYHILKIHIVQLTWIILIQILILKKTLHFRRASCPKHFKDQTNHFSKNQKNWGTS